MASTLFSIFLAVMFFQTRFTQRDYGLTSQETSVESWFNTFPFVHRVGSIWLPPLCSYNRVISKIIPQKSDQFEIYR